MKMNSEEGSAPIELELGIGLVLISLALLAPSFGPYLQRMVFVRIAAVEAAWELVLSDGSEAAVRGLVRQIARNHGVEGSGVAVGFCGGAIRPVTEPSRSDCGPPVKGRELTVVITVGVRLFHSLRCGGKPDGEGFPNRDGRTLSVHPMKRTPRQRGSITLWLLGLGICLLVLGGMGLDMWSTVVLRSRLVGVAEAIAHRSGLGPLRRTLAAHRRGSPGSRTGGSAGQEPGCAASGSLVVGFVSHHCGESRSSISDGEGNGVRVFDSAGAGVRHGPDRDSGVSHIQAILGQLRMRTI